MNWLTNVVRPKIRNILRRETPENLWIKCPDSGQLVFYKDVESNQFVIPGSNYHMRMGAVARLKSIFDNEVWYDIALPDVTADPLRPEAGTLPVRRPAVDPGELARWETDPASWRERAGAAARYLP